jgi:uncharacterized membrane protein
LAAAALREAGEEMTDSFFSKIDEPRIVEAIRAAEGRSLGEIRIHITEVAAPDAVTEGKAVFERLGMTATANRNGVLIFVAPKSHTFAVLGDSGITSIAGTAPLDAIAAAMSSAFRDGRFTDGLVEAVTQAGDFLAAHFPRDPNATDCDELSNQISRG